MSSEQDTELGELISQTLEVNGCLPKLRAELRASIFLALDENVELQNNQPFLNKKISAQLETSDGQNMFCIVREFLEYFGLDFTLSVYEPESYLGRGYHYAGREKVVEDLKIPELKGSSGPLLLQLIHIAQLNVRHQSNTIDINLSTMQNVDSEQSNTSKSDNSNADSEVSERLDSVMNGTVDFNNMNPKADILNATFNLSAPSLSILDKVKPIKDLEGEVISENSKGDDTVDEISSASEEKSRSISLETECSPSFHSKFDSTFEKPKLSPPKNDKKATKNSFGDLSQIQLNKSRSDTVLLPSLYSKEFKDRPGNTVLKETFDLEASDQYEDDFVSDNEITNKSLYSIKNCSDEHQLSESNTSKHSNIGSKGTKSSDINQNPNLPNDKTDYSISSTNVLDNVSKNNSESSDDYNRNIDDILNSTSN